jgi:hypothetical protein
VVRAVIRGWGRAPVDAVLARRIVVRLGELDLQANANEIVRMFFMLDTIDAGRLSWLDLPEARALAAVIGDALASAPEHPTVSIGDAINAPGGRLVEFWVKCLLADEDSGVLAAGRLPSQVSAAFTTLLRVAATRDAAQIVLAAHAHVLLGLDPRWCRRHVLPLFDNRDEATSSRAWRGFLTWGRPVDALLEAGLIDAYVDVATRLPEVSVGNDLQGLLAQHLAIITVGSKLNLSLGWLDQLTTVLSPERRALWFRAVGHQLRDMAPDAVAFTWSIRLSPYWSARVDGRPTSLTPPEASAMAAWIPYLGSAATAAIGLTLRSPASLHHGSSLLDDLDEGFINAHCEEAQRLVVHLLRGTDPAHFVGTAQVQRIVEAIEDSAPHLDHRELRTVAARFGVSPD